MGRKAEAWMEGRREQYVGWEQEAGMRRASTQAVWALALCDPLPPT